ncbi:MAG: adenylate/guanylate cyclase domain-containing protein [Deltaproteobacteria bacterium]|nr:adenylate/guanylate cyclase domain-containing protein [Deltaproteobacteria bacterium]
MHTVKDLKRLQLRVSAFVAVLLALLVVLLYLLHIFKPLDYLLYDLNFRLRGERPVSGKVVLVLMDERSAAGLHRTRYWSRMHLAQAISHLKDAGAEIIALDMLLSVPDPDPMEDIALAGAIADAGNVVMARVATAPGVGEIFALPLFQEAMIGDGFIDLTPDTDDVLRRIHFFHARPLEDGSLQLLPAFSLEVIRAYYNLQYELDFSRLDCFRMGVPPDTIELPYPELIINFRGTYKAFPAISYIDVVQGRFDASIVKGNIVLLGSSLTADKDFFQTPMTRLGSDVGRDVSAGLALNVERIYTPRDLGVACHANAIDTMLQRAFISHMEKWPTAVAIFLVTMLAGIFFISSMAVWQETGVFFLLIVCVHAISFLAFFKWSFSIDTAAMSLGVLSQFLVSLFVKKIFERRTAHLIGDMFGKYVAPAFVSELVNGRVEPSLEGIKKELTILFTDIRGFTTISERLGPQKTAAFLNYYFGRMIPVVFRYGGTLDKLIGDAIMAFFGAPIEYEDHAQRAAQTGVDMLRVLNEIRSSGIEGSEGLNIGIGIATGDVTLGNLGSEEFLNYTVIGDTVNLASRLEGLNKTYGTHILVSERTASQLQGFALREVGEVLVKGKTNPVKVYELMEKGEENAH